MAVWYHNYGNGSTTGYYAVAQWAATHTYAAASIVRQLATPAVGSERCFRTTAGGVSGATEPTWVLTKGGTTSGDGTVTWVEVTGNQLYGWTAPHARYATACSDAAAADSVYSANVSAETQTTAITAVAPITSFSVDTTNTPPVGADVMAGASVTTTGAVNLTLSSSSSSGQYLNGYTLSVGSAGNSGNILFGASNNLCNTVLENCTLVLADTSGTNNLQYAANRSVRTELINTQIQFNAVGQGINLTLGDFIWRDTPSAVGGSTVPTVMLSPNGGTYKLQGLDLSALTTTIVNGAVANATNWKVSIINCKLASGVVVCSTVGNYGQRADLLNSDSSATGYRCESYQYGGTLTTETVVVRSGGAPQTWKTATNTHASRSQPFEAPETDKIVAAGSPITININVITDTAVDATLTNADFWIEARVLDNSGAPISDVYTSAPANQLTAGTAMTSGTSSGTWTTTGLTTPNPQYVSLTFTPQIAGLVRVTPKVSRASLSTLRIDWGF